MLDLQTIINQRDTVPLSEAEMLFVVEQYIEDRKGVSVDIDVYRDYGSDTINAMIYQTQIQKLMEAYNIAKGYYVQLKT